MESHLLLPERKTFCWKYSSNKNVSFLHFKSVFPFHCWRISPSLLLNNSMIFSEFLCSVPKKMYRWGRIVTFRVSDASWRKPLLFAQEVRNRFPSQYPYIPVYLQIIVTTFTSHCLLIRIHSVIGLLWTMLLYHRIITPSTPPFEFATIQRSFKVDASTLQFQALLFSHSRDAW